MHFSSTILLQTTGALLFIILISALLSLWTLKKGLNNVAENYH
jgi:hypothetical protein